MKKFTGFQKGINFGGWLSQRSYDKEYLDSFITEDDFKRVSTWNIDHVRLPVDYNVVETEDGEYIESGFRYIENAIEWCKKYGLNLVLDLHKTAGFVFDNPEYIAFFEDENLQERFYRLWEQFSARFVKYSDMLAFELLNEVTEKKFSDTWNSIIEIAVKRIRKIAPDVKILLGGYGNCSIDAIYDLKIPDDENIVLNFHCYDPIMFTHQSAYWIPEMPRDFHITYPGNIAEYKEKARECGLYYMHNFENYSEDSFSAEYFINRFKKAVEFAEKLGLALYCGEYGVINQADPKETVSWYKDINAAFEKYGIGRAAWSYKEVDYGFIDKHMEGTLDELVKYL